MSSCKPGKIIYDGRTGVYCRDAEVGKVGAELVAALNEGGTVTVGTETLFNYLRMQRQLAKLHTEDVIVHVYNAEGVLDPAPPAHVKLMRNGRLSDYNAIEIAIGEYSVEAALMQFVDNVHEAAWHQFDVEQKKLAEKKGAKP